MRFLGTGSCKPIIDRTLSEKDYGIKREMLAILLDKLIWNNDPNYCPLAIKIRNKLGEERADARGPTLAFIAGWELVNKYGFRG